MMNMWRKLTYERMIIEENLLPLRSSPIAVRLQKRRLSLAFIGESRGLRTGF